MRKIREWAIVGASAIAFADFIEGDWFFAFVAGGTALGVGVYSAMKGGKEPKALGPAASSDLSRRVDALLKEKDRVG